MLGLAIGSFLNVLIDRLPNEESILGRSHCDHCKKDLNWFDLFPILSYVFLGARCRYCGKKLSFVYPLVELATAGMFIFVIALRSQMNFGLGGSVSQSMLSLHVGALEMIALLGIVSSAIVIFFSDLKYQIIPDSIQLSLFAFTFLFIITQGVTPQTFLNHVIASFVVMLPILLLFFATKGRGMGFGDVKLAFCMGFLLGLVPGFVALYIGFVVGAVFGIGLIITGRKKLKSKIAFGPFLIVGLLTMLFFGDKIMFLLRNYYPL